MQRTKIITATSIIGVLMAATAAVGANVGILSSTGETKVGTLSAAGDLTTSTGNATGGPGTSATAVVDAGLSTFSVDQAGTVAVSSTSAGLGLGPVSPNPGWTWTVVDPGPSRVRVRFTDGSRTLELSAHTTTDGTVSATVEEVGGPSTSVRADTERSDDHSSDSHEYEGSDDDD